MRRASCHRFGIVGAHVGARLPQLLQQATAGGFAHVVGVGLERQAPDRESLAAHAFVLAEVVVTLDQLEQMAFLAHR